MIPAFRTAIWAMGSGSLLIAAAALSRDGLSRRPFLVEAEVSATDWDLEHPATIARDDLGADFETSSQGNLPATSPPISETVGPSSTTPPSVFQNASMRTASRQPVPSIQIGPVVPTEKAGKEAVSDAVPEAVPPVVLKPHERLLASRGKILSTDPIEKPVRLATRIYHPIATNVADLERLIRPLLTPGVGTVVANKNAATEERLMEGTADVVLVRDRPEVLSQIDAIYADLEAAPKRVVIDALLADIALPDSVPTGWELQHSRFGVIDGEPRTVVNSLRNLGRVVVIATNQLQVIDHQWAQLEWSERGSQLSASDAFLRLATKFRIRPSVLSNGLVRLEIHPTSSRLKETSSARPQIATVAFTTDIELHIGATALIAGSADERTADAEVGSLAAPNIHAQPRIRHETVLLLMPRISRDN